MKPILIIRGTLSRIHEFDEIRPHFETHYASTSEEYDAVIEKLADSAVAVITNGSIGLNKGRMEKLKRLKLLLCRGAGLENLDLDQAKARGIVVTSGAGVNWFTVADQAMTLLMGIVRDSVEMDRECRRNAWDEGRLVFRPTLYRKKIGIVGLGTIGKGIARRAAGFDMEIHYTARSAKADVDAIFVPSIVELAERVDFLVLSLPGGAETKHVVNGEVLRALGPAGYLVNVARGSVVDTAALVDALRAGVIAGAGLDVWEGEPEVPRELIDAPRTLLSPHVGGFSPEAVNASNRLIMDNLMAFFHGDASEVKNRLW